MNRKQIALLFVVNLLPYIVGNALVTLLPLYTQTLGADATVTGFYMAIAFAMLAFSTVASGWLSKRFGRRRLFMVLAAALSVPAALLMGAAQDMIQLVLATALLWFLFGIGSTMVNILAGLSTEGKYRGRVFGLLNVTVLLAQVIAGTGAGWIIDRWGFSALFIAAAIIYVLLVPLTMLVKEHDEPMSRPVSAQRVAVPPAVSISLPFLLLLAAGLASFSATFMVNMVRVLAMDAQNFSASAITSVIAISGFISMPLPLLSGWISDRLGRRFTLIACYGLVAVGVAMLIPASALWHFWIAQVFVSLINSAQSVGTALTADLVEPETLSVNVARYSAIPWAAAVISFTFSGFAVDHLGIALTLAIGTVLAVVAIPLVYLTRRSQRRPAYAV
ncbi:MAG: MFS transporter [Anaerolineae bacterium]|nr:MFS transporter [Anaerolineae bacterium]